jgi:hypothetical protein
MPSDSFSRDSVIGQVIREPMRVLSFQLIVKERASFGEQRELSISPVCQRWLSEGDFRFPIAASPFPIRGITKSGRRKYITE